MLQNSQICFAKFSNLCDKILKSPFQNSQIYATKFSNLLVKIAYNRKIDTSSLHTIGSFFPNQQSVKCGITNFLSSNKINN